MVYQLQVYLFSVLAETPLVTQFVDLILVQNSSSDVVYSVNILAY